ncbi:MAG: hypothetical protein J2P15_07870 [Micromonosporaceae bacterium]|nr:hypothetical protein [Micromonosporaceae bacterium]
MRQDLMAVAEDWLDRSEDYGSAVAAAVRVEPVKGVEGGFFLYYDPADPDWWIRFDRHTGAQARDRGVAAIEEKLDGTEPIRIREVLSAAEEHFAFGLKVEDHTGIGRFICWYLAMDLAERGDGLVDMNGEWWAPTDHTRPLWTR